MICFVAAAVPLLLVCLLSSPVASPATPVRLDSDITAPVSSADMRKVMIPDAR